MGNYEDGHIPTSMLDNNTNLLSRTLPPPTPHESAWHARCLKIIAKTLLMLTHYIVSHLNDHRIAVCPYCILMHLEFIQKNDLQMT